MKRLPYFIAFFWANILLLLASSKGFSQPMLDTVINWKTVSEVQLLMKTAPRQIMTFFYNPGEDTSRIMLDKTLNQKEICNYVNSRFYAIRIDVTTADSIEWFDQKKYALRTGSPFNELAIHLLGEKPVCPSLLFFNLEKAGSTFKGFKNRYEMRCILVYFFEEVDKTTPFELWAKAYQITYPPFGPPKNLESPIKWHSLKEALALQKKNPKGLFINWYARLNVGSMVILFNAFENPKVAKYMNEHFYCVRLDAHSKDTLYWDKAYFNEPLKGKFNQMALKQLDEKMKFPALLFFDKNRKLTVIQQCYLGPLNFLALASYAGSGSYKTIKFKDFIKTFKADF